MTIWVDADACPVAIKEILFKAADRTHTPTKLLANHPMRVPPSRYIQFIQVSSGFDVADNEIVRRVQTGDLVITQDIPLAKEVIDKGALALSPRGEAFSKENIGARLNIRDFYDTMRASGVQTSGPAALSASDKQQFANQLDKYLQRNKK
ncbi:YaiI/YqxD family protein [Thalassotalea mangrovi]|uniref:YaiI/YqxD family protein n=1 Tax=Thalassotalea mangrovi TaxID=2572245 RepID=UPI001B80B921|nr:YaiI/YqxD family protein [Thalassotalea mangrovi]